MENFAERGVEPLVLMSGRGYHLVWTIRRESRAFRRLVQLGRVEPSLAAKYEQIRSPSGWSIEPDLGRAFAGLGLTMEFVGHRVLAASRKAVRCPFNRRPSRSGRARTAAKSCRSIFPNMAIHCTPGTFAFRSVLT